MLLQALLLFPRALPVIESQMFIFKTLEQFGWLSLTVFSSSLEFVVLDIRGLILLPESDWIIF